MKYVQFWIITVMLSFLSLSSSNPTVNSHNSDKHEFCKTKICEETANVIIESIDHAVDPCNNFYQHACGGWIAKNAIPEDKAYTSNLSEMLEDLQDDVISLVEEMEKSYEDSGSNVRKIVDYYRSCKDEAATNARGYGPLLSIVTANGGWPMTLPSEKWNLEAQNLNLQKIHENYAKVAPPALFAIQVHPAKWDPSVNVLHLKPATDFLARLLKKPADAIVYQAAAYAKYGLAVAKEFAEIEGHDSSSLAIREDFEKIYRLATSRRVRFTIGETESRSVVQDTSYELTTIGQLQTQWNDIIESHPEYMFDWLETIRNFFEGTNIVIDEMEKIVLTPKFVEKFASWLKQASLRTIVNYVHWHAIDHLLLYTHKRKRELANDYFTSSRKPKNTNADRLPDCLANHVMIHGLYYDYSKKYFGGKMTRKSVNVMVDEILEALKQQIDETTWMDDNTKSRSKEKVNNVVANIGYPLWYDEPGKIDEYYGDLDIGLNYFENSVNYYRFESKRMLKKLDDINDRRYTEWNLQPSKLDAHYDLERNVMTFAASFFRLPFFHAERPSVFNYGGIGSIIGHELAHSFDIEGRRFDEFGRYHQWWQSSTVDAYNDRNKCFIDQYSKYTIERYMDMDYKTNGMITLSENLADNVGYGTALKSYLHHKRKDNFRDIRILALQNYTDVKLFFYSIGNTFCSSFVPRARLYLFKSDEHSSDEIRINGFVSNTQEFSDAFNCPIGSPMNPANKCLLWN